jgi:hypothetical protein
VKQLRNESGQLLAILPLAIALSVGGMALWGYNRLHREASLSLRARGDASKITTALLSRFATLMRTATDDPASLASCQTMGVNTKLAALKRLSAPSTNATFEFGYGSPPVFKIDGAASGNSANSWLNCVLTLDERLSVVDPTLGQFQNIQVSISSLGVPDVESFTTSLMVTVRAVTRQNSADVSLQGAVKTLNHRETVSLRASTLSKYALVLRLPVDPNDPASDDIPATDPRISILGGKVNVLGNTFVVSDQSTTPPETPRLDLITPFDESVVFLGSTDIQAKASSYAGGSLVADKLHRIFRGGLKYGVLNSVAKLPIQEGIPNFKVAWGHWIDYIPSVTAAPPQPTVNLNVGPTAQVVSVNVGPNSYPVNNVGALAPTGSRVSHDNPNTTVYSGSFDQPVSTATWDTCDDAGANNRVYVQLASDQMITLDYTTLGAAPGLRHFCGLIMARKVTINIGTEDRQFIGQIITKQLIVNGSAGKTLTIANPFDNKPVPGFMRDQSKIATNIRVLSQSTAHNFFVPVFKTVANLPVAVANDQFLYYPFRPHGALMLQDRWTNNLTTPLETPATPWPRVGYIFGCGGGSEFCPPSSLVSEFTPLSTVEISASLTANGGAMDKEILYE